MVKIKEGYVMSAREREEYQRRNAEPRKTSGTVAYYFKPQTKYPPRIYVFIDAGIWCDRNRRPMGLQNAFPFLTRPMNREEIEYHHFDWRLCYHQYEDWDKLIYAEEKEEHELDKEKPGTGTAFLNGLKSFREKYPLGADKGEYPPVPPGIQEDEDTAYLRELIDTGDTLDAAEVGRLLDDERKGEKQPAVMMALQQLYGNFGKPAEKQQSLVETEIQRKLTLKAERSRRNFVRRVYKSNPLFALEEINAKFPGYTPEMLAADLKRKCPPKEKRKKKKPITDLRQCQFIKLANLIKYREFDDNTYHQTCNKIVMLQNAHNLRLPVPISVKLDNKTLVYSFNWKTREPIVKSFVEMANRKGMPHAELQNLYEEIVQSPFSI